MIDASHRELISHGGNIGMENSNWNLVCSVRIHILWYLHAPFGSIVGSFRWTDRWMLSKGTIC